MKTKILITSTIIEIGIIVSFGYIINFGNEILNEEVYEKIFNSIKKTPLTK